MAKQKHSVLSSITNALFGQRKPKPVNPAHQSPVGVLHFNRQPWNPFWLGLKGATSRQHPGQQALTPDKWPDVEKYGMTPDGSIRRRVPKTPFRLRRWRKRAAAALAKSGGHSLDYAKTLVAGIESGVRAKAIAGLKKQA